VLLLLKIIIGVNNMIESLQQKLKQHGYKITPQRNAILNVLQNSKNNLISVENILKETKTLYSKTNMSTVYRNLEMLENIALVHKLITEDGLSLYKLNCTDEHHHHIICKNCGKTDVINYCPMEHLKDETIKKSFKLTDHKLELYGYCKDCHI